jgi:hypothetical protein
MMRPNTGVIYMLLLVMAVCATTPALGLKYVQKRQGQPAMQRRRLRKHNKEVVQVPKGERRKGKGSNKNSYKQDESDYPAYLSGFYDYGEQTERATHDPTYSPTYGYDEAQPRDHNYGPDNDNGYNGPYQQGDYYLDPNREYYYPYEYQDGSNTEAYNQEDGYYEQPPGNQHHEQVEQYMESEPQPQPPPYYPEIDEYSADEAVYSYLGKEKKHGTKGIKVGGTSTKEGSRAGKKTGNKGVSTKYAEVKVYKSKGKKGSYYEYAVKEETLHGGIHAEVIYDEYDHSGEVYASEDDILHDESHDELIGPFPDSVYQELDEVILEQTLNHSVNVPVPEENYYPPRDEAKSKKGNPTSKSAFPAEAHYPVVKGSKGEQLHSRSKSSSCSKGKGKGKSGDGFDGKKKSKSHNYYYYTELLDTESWDNDECTSTKTSSKKSSRSGKKSKSQGKGVIEYRKSFAGKTTFCGFHWVLHFGTSLTKLAPYTSFPTFGPSFEGNGTAPTPFGELTAVPSSSSEGGLIPVSPSDSEDGETNTLLPTADEPAASPTSDEPATSPTTDEPATSPTADEPAGTPSIPASLAPTMLIDVDFIPFGLLYDIDRSAIPPDTDYAAAAIVSGMCISNYFSVVYGPDADSIYRSSELLPGSIAYSLLSGAISDYTGNAMFSDAAFVPTPDELDVTIGEAFTGDPLIECMNLFAMQLPPENLFSTVTNIRKVEPSTTMPTGRRRRYSTSSFSLQQGIFMVTAFGMVGILVFMGGRMWLGSRRKRHVAEKGGAYFGGDDIIMGDNLNGYLVER